MSNNRNLLILAVVLVAAGVLYSLTSRQRSHVDASGGFVDLYEGTLATTEVWGIEVHKGGDPEAGFSLAKQGDDWSMTSHFDAPANVNKIRTLLGNVEGAEGELRSDDGDVLDAYALADSQAIHLVLRNESGDPLLHWLVGKRSGQGGFVRRDGSNRAYLASHNFLSDFGIWGDELGAPTHTSWLELQVHKEERDDIHAIQLVSDAGTVRMRKEFAEPEVAEGDSTAAPVTPAEYEWRVEEPGNFLAKKTVADGILGNVASLRARDVVGTDADNPAYGLGDDAARVVVTYADGTEETLWFGAEFPDDDSQVHFRKEGEDLVWALPSYLRTNIFKPVDELRPE